MRRKSRLPSKPWPAGQACGGSLGSTPKSRVLVGFHCRKRGRCSCACSRSSWRRASRATAEACMLNASAVDGIRRPPPRRRPCGREGRCPSRPIPSRSSGRGSPPRAGDRNSRSDGSRPDRLPPSESRNRPRDRGICAAGLAAPNSAENPRRRPYFAYTGGHQAGRRHGIVTGTVPYLVFSHSLSGERTPTIATIHIPRRLGCASHDVCPEGAIASA